MPQVDNPKRLWRSVEDYSAAHGDERPRGEHGYPELVGREFPVGATEIDGATRRDFLKLVGLTAAGTMAAGCMRNPPERILPYTRQPADVRPGLPLHYATSASLDGFGMGLLVTAREGRPIKVEGNPDHPSSLGASGTFEQGLAYGVYDPQRGKAVKLSGQVSGWKSFIADLRARLPEWQKDGGAKVRFLDGPTASPLDAWLREQVKAVLPNAKWHTYAAVSRDAVYAGTEIAFGTPLEPRLDLDQARVILSLDDDFLEEGPDRLAHARAFAAHRVPEPEEEHHGTAEHEGAVPHMNRLYVAECSFTPTGVAADHRLRAKASDIFAIAAAVYAEVAAGEAGELAALAGPWKGHKWVKAVAKDLVRGGARALVTAGIRQPAEVHAIAAAINAAVKSTAVRYVKPALLDTRSGPASLAELVQAANRREIDTLVITAWNPVYTAPPELHLADALRNVPNVVYHGAFEDETSGHARWYLPALHELESWGDSANADGVIALQQPLMAPMFGGVQRAELFAAFANKVDRGAYQLLKEAHAARMPGGADKAGFELMWERMLQKGVVTPTPAQPATAALQAAQVVARARAYKGPKATGLELNLIVDNKVHDGRFGDNAWLQELPDPLTKVTWGNVAILSPKTAGSLGVETEEIVSITVGDATIQAPVYVLPGHADDALSIALGYGRTGAEVIARGVGANAYVLRSQRAPWFGADVKLGETGKKDRLGITQEHWAMEGRPIALAADLEAFHKKDKVKLRLIEEQNGEQASMHPRWESETGGRVSGEPYEKPSGDGYIWAMAIDMSKCTGCNACILACEAENNILIVGKDQIRRGREMHWLRIDRYFEGESLDDPQVVTQPMACVQCEKAPCEYVCPVNATVHSDEGLNDMVYNRCVGTRYCANNCPYKVRRFNYLNWHNNLQGTLELKMNPDVTVRSRGVIEKCTYCVQRIEQARIAARISNKGEGRMLKDGEVVVACQQSCASGAISFGSLHDKASVVSKKHKDERAYQVLWELNTRPRTRHLAKVRNPNPELA